MENCGTARGCSHLHMVDLASVHHKLQQVAPDLGENLTVDVVLDLNEMDGPAPTHPRHTLRMSARFFNSLSEKRRKKTVYKSWKTRVSFWIC